MPVDKGLGGLWREAAAAGKRSCLKWAQGSARGPRGLSKALEGRGEQAGKGARQGMGAGM